MPPIFLTIAGPNFYSWLQHCVEIPEGMEKMSIAQIEDLLSSAQTEAFDYIEVIPDMTDPANRVPRPFNRLARLETPAATSPTAARRTTGGMRMRTC